MFYSGFLLMKPNVTRLTNNKTIFHHQRQLFKEKKRSDASKPSKPPTHKNTHQNKQSWKTERKREEYQPHRAKYPPHSTRKSTTTHGTTAMKGLKFTTLQNHPATQPKETRSTETSRVWTYSAGHECVPDGDKHTRQSGPS